MKNIVSISTNKARFINIKSKAEYYAEFFLAYLAGVVSDKRDKRLWKDRRLCVFPTMIYSMNGSVPCDKCEYYYQCNRSVLWEKAGFQSISAVLLK